MRVMNVTTVPALSTTNFFNTTTASAVDGAVDGKRQYCEAPIRTEYIIQLTILILILIATLIGNLLVLLAVIFFRRLRSITNYFIVSLAVSDLLIALLSLPFKIDQIVHNASWCLSLEACQTWLIVESACTYASMWNLAVISIDRFIAIRRPFQYHSLITTKVCYGMIASVWTYSIILSLLMLINWSEAGAPHFFIQFECSNNDRVYYTVAASLSFFLPLVIIMVTYGMVFEVALNHAKAIAAFQVEAGRQRRSSINMIREVKASKTLAVVVGCFVFCWLPFNIILQILLWEGPQVFLRLNVRVLKFVSYTFIYGLPAVNSAMNPIIYALLNREFRTAFSKLFKRIIGRRLGAVGYGGASMESTASSATNINNHNTNGHSRGIRFQNDHDSESSNPLPTIPQLDPNSYNSQAYTELLKPIDSNSNTNPDTRSLETTLDDDKKTKMEDSAAPAQNGHLSNDVKQSDNDVILINRDVTQCDNDIIENDIEGSPKMAKLPSLQSSPSSSMENDVTPAPFVKPGSLPPIESNHLEVDNMVDTVAIGTKGTKLKVSPSPECEKKRSEDKNLSGNDADVEDENTPL